MRSNNCPKCQSSMSIGFIADKTDNGSQVASWVEGAPVRSRWFGLKLGQKAKLEIQTWRCARCGFLESYATG